MPESDLFVGLAEVAIVFAGFSGISVVLSRRSSGTWSNADARRIATMVESSLAFALFALLPLALWGLGLSGPTLWALCSAGLAIYMSSSFVRGVRSVSELYREEPSERDRSVWVVAMFGGAFVAIVVQCMNVLAFGFERSSGPYLFGLIVGLASAARLFLRSLSSLRQTLSGNQE